jgi:hypothetical protein
MAWIMFERARTNPALVIARDMFADVPLDLTYKQLPHEVLSKAVQKPPDQESKFLLRA